MSAVRIDARGPVTRVVLRAPVVLYRWHLGFLLGGRFLLLVHTGRRTGRRYRTVVEVVGRDDNCWYVMSGFGRSADWYRNVTAAKTAEIHVAGRTHRVTVTELDPVQATAVLGDYERRNRWAAPVVKGVLSRLVGWRYTGSGSDRRRLVEQLPILQLAADRTPPP